MTKLLLTPEEAAAELGCDGVVIDELVRLEELSALPIPTGNGTTAVFKILRADLDDYILRGAPEMASVLRRVDAAVRGNRAFPEPAEQTESGGPEVMSP